MALGDASRRCNVIVFIVAPFFNMLCHIRGRELARDAMAVEQRVFLL
jgi:hypothetical protein